jgi:hypothetical protein
MLQVVFFSSDKKHRLVNLALAGALVFALHSRSEAHDGPPIPLFVDRNLGSYSVSVWADPDVGTGTFFVVPVTSPKEVVGNAVEVEVCARPASGRLDEVCYAAKPDTSVRNTEQYKVELPFDAAELWHVRVILKSPAGEAETATDVQVTATGMGRWELLLYLSPFMAVGFLWVMAVLKRREVDSR